VGGQAQSQSQQHSNLPADSDEEEIAYEFSIPLSERETALTARDRDLIEQGDWSAIHDELSDNDFSLVGKRFSDGHKHGLISSIQGGASAQNQQQSSNSSISVGGNNGNNGSNANAKAAPAAPPGGVHNPRGGRHFRSSTGEDGTGSNTNSTSSINPPGGGGAGRGGAGPASHHQQHNFRNHAEGFSVEDSDEDDAPMGMGGSGGNANIAGGGGVSGKQVSNGGKRSNNISPRRNVDKLDPIPLPLNSNEEQGILSGRRFDSKNAPGAGGGGAGGAAPGRRDVGRNSSDGGFAPIYPSLGVAPGKDGGNSAYRGDKDANNSKFFHIVGNSGAAAKREEDALASEERYKKEASGARVAALGKLKVHGPTGSSSSANIVNDNGNGNMNNDFNLNVMGNNFGGGAGALGLQSDAGGGGAIKPANKKVR
jgi:hypothetical protein